ncbi:MAG: hypothetical protein CM15mV86_550 [uncultured marine virus]|nr:MAG: hypothetical protein CM15mV86_550 [uncultured marine virus]
MLRITPCINHQPTNREKITMNKTQIKNAINNANVRALHIATLGKLRRVARYGRLPPQAAAHDAQRRTLRPKTGFGLASGSLLRSKNLINAVDNPHHFRPSDILHCQQSYLLAHALLDAYPEKVKGAVECLRRYVPEFDSLDYTCGQIVVREEVAA